MSERTTWTLLHTRLHRLLRSRPLLPRNQRLLVAVSGGQDSLCLMQLLLDLQPKWGWHLAIAHCDHGWSTDDGIADHVAQLAASWQTPFYLYRAATVTESEAAARQWRYQTLAESAARHGYRYIVTGHTASDRAETLLYNLVRGSGADGLQALTWRRNLADLELVRPLLNVTRAETGQFCQLRKLPVWEDAANQNLKFARNRIRQELLPYLAQFNPQVEQTLAQTAELLAAEVDYLETAAQGVLQQAMSSTETESCSVITHSSGNLGMNRQVLRTAPLALQRRAMRQFLIRVMPCAPEFEHIEKLVALISAPNRSQTDPFPGGAIAWVENNWIWLKHD